MCKSGNYPVAAQKPVAQKPDDQKPDAPDPEVQNVLPELYSMAQILNI